MVAGLVCDHSLSHRTPVDRHLLVRHEQHRKLSLARFRQLRRVLQRPHDEDLRHGQVLRQALPSCGPPITTGTPAFRIASATL